jgi:MFS family permease
VTILDFITRPRVAYTLILASLSMYVFQSFVSFFPTFLIEFHSYGKQTASTLFGVAFVVSTGATPFFGWLSDRIGRDSALTLAFSAAAVGLAATVFGTGPVILGGVVCVGAGLSWGGVLQARFMDIFSETERGTGFGLARTVFLLVGSVGNTITGVIAEASGWTLAFSLAGSLLIVAVALIGLNQLFDTQL